MFIEINSLTNLVVTSCKYLGNEDTRTDKKCEYKSINVKYAPSESLAGFTPSQLYSSMADIKLLHELLSNLETFDINIFNTVLKLETDIAWLCEIGKLILDVKLSTGNESF